jgi:hypothetical protein
MHRRRGEVTFGKDGKPFFVNGPNDNTRAIVDQLEKTAGTGNYNYLVMVGEDIEEFTGSEHEGVSASEA